MSVGREGVSGAQATEWLCMVRFGAFRDAGVDCPALPIPPESTAAGLQGFLSLLYYAKFSSGWTQDIPAQ